MGVKWGHSGDIVGATIRLGCFRVWGTIPIYELCALQMHYKIGTLCKSAPVEASWTNIYKVNFIQFLHIWLSFILEN